MGELNTRLEDYKSYLNNAQISSRMCLHQPLNINYTDIILKDKCKTKFYIFNFETSKPPNITNLPYIPKLINTDVS